MQTTHVLLYIPNLIGYFRICLIILAWYYFDKPTLFLSFYITQALLDVYCTAVDGWAARRFDQVSQFGAWFDVIIDNIGRGILWTRISSIGIFITSIEWITFIALDSHGSDWKSKLTANNDLIVRNIMRNGFRTPFGFLTIVLGIHCLPIVIYILEHQLVLGWPTLLLYNIKHLCIIGRLFSLYCEVYIIRRYIAENFFNEQP